MEQPKGAGLAKDGLGYSKGLNAPCYLNLVLSLEIDKVWQNEREKEKVRVCT